MPENPKTLIEQRAQQAIALEKTVADRIASLKAEQEHINDEWASVEKLMIDNNVKSIKGDWGSLTIIERINWQIDEDILPKKFFKKVADTKKITDTFRLEGRAPKGAEPKYTKYLSRRIK